MNKNIILAVVIVAAAAALYVGKRIPREEGGKAEAPAASAQETLARVGEREIRRADLDRFIAGLPAAERESAQEDREAVLDHLIRREQLLLAARADRGESPAATPAAAGESPEDAEIQAWIEARLRDVPAPTDEEIRAFFEERKAEMPPGIEFDQISRQLADFLTERRRVERFEKLLADVEARFPAQRFAEAIARLNPPPAEGDIPPPGAPLGIPRLVSLGADACVPCKMMAPIREEIKADYAGKLRVDFIDVWKDRRAARLYRIRAIPTLIFYAADGREIGRREGYTPKDQILAVWRNAGIEL